MCSFFNYGVQAKAGFEFPKTLWSQGAAHGASSVTMFEASRVSFWSILGSIRGPLATLWTHLVPEVQTCRELYESAPTWGPFWFPLSAMGPRVL